MATLPINSPTLLFLPRSLRVGIASAAFFGVASLAGQAATVLWNAPQNVEGEADVRTDGVLVTSASIGPDSMPLNPVINGVVFPLVPKALSLSRFGGHGEGRREGLLVS
jgi:hypothetical protein